MLSSVHRIIDRAAGYVPSPEDLQAELPDELTSTGDARASETPPAESPPPSSPAEDEDPAR